MIISKTPFRLSFFGGGTDYPVWFREHSGAVLSTTFDKYAYISCRYLPPFFEYKSRISYSLIEHVKRMDQIKHPAVRACLKHMDIRQGVEIHHDGDLPARTGLGSSSSFTVGLLRCLHALRRRSIGSYNLGLEAIRVEQKLIPENVGCQDQMAAAMGGMNLMRFGPGDKIAVQPFVLLKKRLDDLQSHLMLVFTGFSRFASQIAGEFIRSAPRKKAELKLIYESVFEAVKILKRRSGASDDLSDFGRLLHENWMIKRKLVSGVTTPEVDDLYAAARKAGAVGGKLLGAGGGGFVLLFAKPRHHGPIRRALRRRLHIPFQFETLGSQIVFYKQDEYERPENR